MRTLCATVLIFATISVALGKINENCYADKDCTGKGEACISNKCKCGVSYRQGNELNCVFVIGSNCEAHDECENLPGATCDRNKCTCKAGWLLGAKECNKIGKENDECTSHADCINRSVPPDDNKECRDTKCVCKGGFHLASDKTCTQTRGLEDTCSVNDDCYQEDNNHNNSLECKDEDGNKICKCKDGYKQEGDLCNGCSAEYNNSMSRSHRGAFCVEDIECLDVLGTKSLCVANECQCAPHFHINNLNLCVRDRGLKEFCQQNDDCYWGPEMVEKLECSLGVCSCKHGYVPDKGKICVKYFASGSSITKTIPLLMFLVFITVLSLK